ncbi:hypothetical protein BHM03_00059988 [Ensete ventricosum]|nr:hypothetical protein BHM03_00059988 [Ensete ventricosum]
MPMSLSCYWVSSIEQLDGLVVERDSGSWLLVALVESTPCYSRPVPDYLAKSNKLLAMAESSHAVKSPGHMENLDD